MPRKNYQHTVLIIPRRDAQLKRAGSETRQEVSRSATADRTACPRDAWPMTIRSAVVRARELKSAPTASLIERIERALVLLAYFIELDGASPVRKRP